ncbi:hypothetical protein EAM_0269 [Erwinia amylovora ATCC 49946]|nr:hypothetical protein EAM_0269 [Erwinia amylovora ATCC 49946]
MILPFDHQPWLTQLHCVGHPDLNWEWYITETGNRDDCFELGIKLITSREHKLVESSPAGVSMSTYSISAKTFDIHAVDNLSKDSEDHPFAPTDGFVYSIRRSDFYEPSWW